MSRNVERNLISAVVNVGDLSDALNAGVAGDWFREYRREWQFLTIRYRKTRKVPSKGTFKAKFPSFRLAEVDDIEFAIGEMKTYHARQSLMGMMTDAVEEIEEGTTITETIASMYRGLVDLQGALEGTENETDIVSNWRSTYVDAYKRSRRAKHGNLVGLPTGFPTLDLVTGGLQPGWYVVYAARLGQGKTWSLVRTATEALKAGATVQFHALEQSRTQLGIRFAPFLSRAFNNKDIFKASELNRGQGDLRAFKSFLVGLPNHTNGGKLIIDDTPRGKLNSIALASKIERHDPDLVVIDYLGLMSDTPGDWTALAALSSDIKQMAMDYKKTIVVANQLNRQAAVGKAMAGPEMLSGSDNIGMDADLVVTMRKASKRVSQMYVAKNRHDEDGHTWYCKFDVNVGILEEISEEKAMDLKDEDE